MRKNKPPPINTVILDPLELFAKKIGCKIPKNESKEILKDLLKSTLMVPQCQPEFSSYFANVNKVECIDTTVKKYSEVYDDNCQDKFNEIHPKQSSNDERKVEDETNVKSKCVCSLMDEMELSFDGKWLRQHLELPLKMAMKEILTRKPYDPINYLGFLLLHYKKCGESDQWKQEQADKLAYIRSLIKEPQSISEECVLVDRGEGEEEIADWNFKYYESSQTPL